MADAKTLGLAAHGTLSIEGSASVLNRGFRVCPTPLFTGVPSTEPGSARSFAEPSFQDRLTFTSTTLAVGTSNSVRVVIGFSDGGRREQITVRDETSATGRRTTNFVVHPSAQRTATLVAYRANGTFSSQVAVDATNPNGIYTLPVEVGGTLSLAAQLRNSAEARPPRGGDVIHHQVQYQASVSVTVEPLHPAVGYRAESGASYLPANALRLACLALTNGTCVIRVPPGLKLQSAVPLGSTWTWTDRAEQALLLVDPTNRLELFRAVAP